MGLQVLSIGWVRRLLAGVALLGVAALAGIWPSLAGAAPGTPLYPDVRALPPSDIHLGRETVNFERHYVIRFSTYMYNAGPGRLEIQGTPRTALDLNFQASQWIYEDPAGVTTEPIGTLFWHDVHSHFHFDGYGRYELWTKTGYDRAAASGFTKGAPLYMSPKVSFCMMDSTPIDQSTVNVRYYQTCTPLVQGVSAGWADLYDWTLPDQWIDVGTSRLPDGQYVLRNIADPNNIVFESPGKADPAKESQIANSGVTPVTIVNGQVAS